MLGGLVAATKASLLLGGKTPRYFNRCNLRSAASELGDSQASDSGFRVLKAYADSATRSRPGSSFFLTTANSLNHCQVAYGRP